MSNYTLLVEHYSKLELTLTTFIESKKTKNISWKERDTFVYIESLLININSIIKLIEQDIAQIIFKNANNEGKVAQLTDILKLCHQDYSLNGKTNEATILYRALCSI